MTGARNVWRSHHVPAPLLNIKTGTIDFGISAANSTKQEGLIRWSNGLRRAPSSERFCGEGLKGQGQFRILTGLGTPSTLPAPRRRLFTKLIRKPRAKLTRSRRKFLF